jgi:hypothetical protein
LAKRTKSARKVGGNHSARRRLIRLRSFFRKEMNMFGKLASAWLGSRMLGRQSGAKGALLGIGVAALARRGLGPLAAVAALGWGAKKLYERRDRRSPAYPSDATPAPPAA